jgi:predicted dehydrogenase
MRLQRYLKDEDRSWHKALDKTTVPLEVIDPLAAQIAHFCDLIRGKAEPWVSVHDGLQNLRVVEAIHEAARTGQIVRIQQG